MEASDKTALITLFQLVDSIFPSGAYAYSFGLETFVQEEKITDRKGFECFLKAYLYGLVVRSDGLVVKLSWEAAIKSELESLLALDQRSEAMKLVHEFREASRQMGRQLLKVANKIHPTPLLEKFATELENSRTAGHHAVVFGMICSCLGIARIDAVLAYLYTIISGLLGAALRLIPLGEIEGQHSITAIKGALVKIAEEILPLGLDDMYTFAPELEIMGMRHESLYSRLFRS